MKAKLPKGVGGGPSNMQSMIKQAQKIQDDMTALQEQLDTREYEIKAGGGVVTVRINGKLEVLSIDISPEVVDPDDIETLSDIITAGVNEAIKKVTETNNEEMSKVTGGLNVPGFPGLF
ncbi:MAG: YbaB/EbfC family nucleoid-associated protein [Eubacteriales bacterium]